MKRNRSARHYLFVKSRKAGILKSGGPTPVPLCPSRRIQAALNGLDAPPLFRGPGRIEGGVVPSPVRRPNYSGQSVAPFSGLADRKCNVEWPVSCSLSHFTASSFEFVAKPEQAAKAVVDLPAGIPSGLEDFAGFAGSLVMVSRLGGSLDHRDHFLARKRSEAELRPERPPRARAPCSLRGPLFARAKPAGAPAVCGGAYKQA
jgi:hypothetical protein